MSSRVELVKRLSEIETYMSVLENNLAGIESTYFNKGSISFRIDTADFQYEHLEENSIDFTKEIMILFMKTQLKDYKIDSKTILEKLLE